MKQRKNSNGQHKKGRGSPSALQNASGLSMSIPIDTAQETEANRTYATEGEDRENHTAGKDSQKKKGKETSFSKYMATILHRDRPEITRIAQELHITENTIYRWMKGHCIPREAYLKQLPDLFPAYRYKLAQVINQTFPGVLDASPSTSWQVGKDIYTLVIQQVTGISNPIDRLWSVARSIFEYIAVRINGERKGITFTFARICPPRNQSDNIIRSLREEVVLPTTSEENKIFLGGTSLAGSAASSMRMQIWDSGYHDSRLQVAVDENEACACTVPVVRGGKIAGVLIISCAYPGFFSDTLIPTALGEFAQLLALALLDADFYPPQHLLLAPMPSIKIQRAKLAAEYHDRIYAYIDLHNASLAQATAAVQTQLEKEFEEFEYLGSHMLHLD